MNDTISNVEPLLNDLSSLNLASISDSFPAHNQPEISDGEKFVVFFLGDALLAVCAAQVAEIVRPLDFTPLPNSPEWLHGIANLRGEIVSVLNLPKIFDKPGAAASSKSKFIVLKTETGASSVALPVDRLSEIITLEKKDIRPADDFRFAGSAIYKAASVTLLDTEKLFVSLLLN